MNIVFLIRTFIISTRNICNLIGQLGEYIWFICAINAVQIKEHIA